MKGLSAFALPIMATNLLSAVYNIVDMIIVGQFAGTPAMSAVSIGGQVTFLILMVCNGLSNGCSVLVGNLFGLKQTEEIRHYVGSMLSFLTLLALILTAAGISLCGPLLRALNTPAESFRETERYLIICLAGNVFVYGYGLLSAALRGAGESVHPLLYMVITTVENVVLDLLFVGALGWGAGGAAAATVISQATSLILVSVFIGKSGVLFDFRPASFHIHRDKLKRMLKVGLPQAIQYTCTSISFLFLASLVNAYGLSASAAAGAATKLGTFGMLPANSSMSAIMTFTAQNHPSRNYKRILRGLACGMGLALALALVFFALCQAVPEAMYRLFVDDPEVIRVGTDYLRIYSVSFLDETIMFCLFGVMTGAGYTMVTMVTMVTSAFGVRYASALLLSRCTALGFNGIALAYSAAPLLGIAVAGVFLLSGKWKEIRTVADKVAP
ncbi:MAG: MATE family efflux transporter [Oscillospiraceae bacterium]